MDTELLHRKISAAEKPTSHQERVVSVTERVLANPRNPGSFHSREQEFKGKFSKERAERAFRDLKKHRDRAYGEQRIVHCSEVCLHCEDINEALDRVREVVGPVSPEQRDLLVGKMGPFREVAFRRHVNIATGFHALVSDQSGESTHRSLRVDWDEAKGYHYNVLIMPEGVKHKDDPAALDIAFTFPDPSKGFVAPDKFIAVLARQMEELLIEEQYLKTPFQVNPAYQDNAVNCLFAAY